MRTTSNRGGPHRSLAMVAAGYDSRREVLIFDRLTDSQGKTGGWFSDLFGKTTPEQKRLREMEDCRKRSGRVPRPSHIRSAGRVRKMAGRVPFYRPEENRERLPDCFGNGSWPESFEGDISVSSSARPGERISSPRRVCADRARTRSLKVVFQIPVEHVDYYSVTSDEKMSSCLPTLLVREMEHPGAKTVEVRELVLRRDCIENHLTRWNYLACIDTRFRRHH